MQEQLIDSVLEKFENHSGNFPVREHHECAQGFKTFELNYHKDEGLHELEEFGEGVFTIGNKIRVERKYLVSGSLKHE